jgi:hypothetical protein
VPAFAKYSFSPVALGAMPVEAWVSMSHSPSPALSVTALSVP